ncbi:hypothetical protein AVEN_35815-1 [Araneus ventricosus]|uniref:C2H2-type domain-containing protein n=1 Tax=Araneus ventricosus TaxID=182803 RepID=A0A4Y2BJ54_ARAVE|nr:hypothetical protein AVEN_35815-1 [Araneus ventricosus]
MEKPRNVFMSFDMRLKMRRKKTQTFNIPIEVSKNPFENYGFLLPHVFDLSPFCLHDFAVCWERSFFQNDFFVKHLKTHLSERERLPDWKLFATFPSV